MIQIKQLTKKFGNQEIIKDLNIDFPDHGLIAITGPSGCGKTTLLNIISGIDQNADGEVLFNGIDVLKMSEKETLDYRLHHVGYVFQNFNLIPLETGERNVLLPFESSTNNSLSFKKRKIRRLFQIFNISHLRRTKTTNMSGGEKQRIAILRAIVNNPRVVLCDEPTGALDEKNAFEIMQIIRQISVNSLIIVVSHDKELMKIFADEIISMKDGFIMSRAKNKLPKAEVAPIETSGKRTKHAKIPTSFKIRYSIGKMKSKTIRTLISNIMLSLSLTGIGISFLLSSIITKKINQAFESLTNGNQIVMRLKNESLNTYGEIFSALRNIVEKIAKKYENETIGVGVNYLANFEDIFKDQNEIYFIADGKRSQLKNYSVRNFNEYKWYTHKTITFPYSASLAKDDVVLGMTYEDMSNLCYEYKIQRSFYSLGQFLTKANAQINLLVANNEWEYDDEQVFNVVGVVQTSHPLFYHSDSLWNEYVFEECMRFPSFEGGEQYAPWELKKNYFLQCQSGVEELENKLMFDPDFYGYIFQKTNYDFNPVLCKSTANCNENRLYVYYSNINGIKLSDVDYISQFFPSLKQYFFTSYTVIQVMHQISSMVFRKISLFLWTKAKLMMQLMLTHRLEKEAKSQLIFLKGLLVEIS